MASTTLLQPLLPQLRDTFHGYYAVPLIAGATPLGYMAGLCSLVPLSDGRDIRKLIAQQGVCLSVALAIQATSRTLPVLAAAAFITGALATIPAHTMALAVRLSPDRRGRAVGTIAMGISLGLVLSRAASGVLGQHCGWRSVPAAAAALILAATLLSFHVTPPTRAAGDRVGPIAALRELIPTLRKTPGLPRRAIMGALWFATFSAFWAALAIHLAGAPLKIGPAGAGAFGLLGAAGALAAQFGGRAVDGFGATRVTQFGIATAIVGFFVLAVLGHDLGGLSLGTLLMDAGLFVAQSANQAAVLGLQPDRQGQVYAAYMASYYGAGAAGAAAGPWILQVATWPALCLTSATMLAVALITASLQDGRTPVSRGQI